MLSLSVSSDKISSVVLLLKITSNVRGVHDKMQLHPQWHWLDGAERRPASIRSTAVDDHCRANFELAVSRIIVAVGGLWIDCGLTSSQCDWQSFSESHRHVVRLGFRRVSGSGGLFPIPDRLRHAVLNDVCRVRIYVMSNFSVFFVINLAESYYVRVAIVFVLIFF